MIFAKYFFTGFLLAAISDLADIKNSTPDHVKTTLVIAGLIGLAVDEIIKEIRRNKS